MYGFPGSAQLPFVVDKPIFPAEVEGYAQCGVADGNWSKLKTRRGSRLLGGHEDMVTAWSLMRLIPFCELSEMACAELCQSGIAPWGCQTARQGSVLKFEEPMYRFSYQLLQTSVPTYLDQFSLSQRPSSPRPLPLRCSTA